MLITTSVSKLLFIFASTWSRFVVPSSALASPCSAAIRARPLAQVLPRSSIHSALLVSLAAAGLLVASARSVRGNCGATYLWQYHAKLECILHTRNSVGAFALLLGISLDHGIFPAPSAALWHQPAVSNILSYQLTRSFARIVQHTTTDMYLIQISYFHRSRHSVRCDQHGNAWWTAWRHKSDYQYDHITERSYGGVVKHP